MLKSHKHRLFSPHQISIDTLLQQLKEPEVVWTEPNRLGVKNIFNNNNNNNYILGLFMPYEDIEEARSKNMLRSHGCAVGSIYFVTK